MCIRDRYDTDNETHVRYMTCCANLRGLSFSLPASEMRKVQYISGRTTPRLAATRGMIAGAMCFEILKVIAGRCSSVFRNLTADMETGSFDFTQPPAPEKIVDRECVSDFDCRVKAIPFGFTVWDFIRMEGPLPMDEFVKLFEAEFQVHIILIWSGNIIFLNRLSETSDLPSATIEEIYVRESGRLIPQGVKYLEISLTASDDDNNELSLIHI
eukprot:TRINITY_DN9196_c0_g1_i1.p1 TRINITY_DN9196_c0_g1~~TRINITY_DN9196_c0_g1_i1.p1  ORF type:complete len:232 (+),score=42.89 TRINITY_DN9196_c0_g1_i1:60-698(+)